jgi:hypothetical protein
LKASDLSYGVAVFRRSFCIQTRSPPVGSSGRAHAVCPLRLREHRAAQEERAIRGRIWSTLQHLSNQKRTAGGVYPELDNSKKTSELGQSAPLSIWTGRSRAGRVGFRQALAEQRLRRASVFSALHRTDWAARWEAEWPCFSTSRGSIGASGGREPAIGADKTAPPISRLP